MMVKRLHKQTGRQKLDDSTAERHSILTSILQPSDFVGQDKI